MEQIRPVCRECGRNPCAPNYWRDGVRHWRTRCAACEAKRRGKTPPKAKWATGGYRKKSQCDLCGFKSKWSSQITVWHINGNLNDVALTNLRSVCLNCVEEVKRKLFTWNRGDLTPD